MKCHPKNNRIIFEVFHEDLVSTVRHIKMSHIKSSEERLVTTHILNHVWFNISTRVSWVVHAECMEPLR